MGLSDIFKKKQNLDLPEFNLDLDSQNQDKISENEAKLDTPIQNKKPVFTIEDDDFSPKKYLNEQDKTSLKTEEKNFQETNEEIQSVPSFSNEEKLSPIENVPLMDEKEFLVKEEPIKKEQVEELKQEKINEDYEDEEKLIPYEETHKKETSKEESKEKNFDIDSLFAELPDFSLDSAEEMIFSEGIKQPKDFELASETTENDLFVKKSKYLDVLSSVDFIIKSNQNQSQNHPKLNNLNLKLTKLSSDGFNLLEKINENIMFVESKLAR